MPGVAKQKQISDINMLCDESIELANPGMSLSYEIIKAHCGEIIVNSKAYEFI